MKCAILYRDGITNSTAPHLDVTVLAENASEGFQLGVIAMQLRCSDIWCVLDEDHATLKIMSSKPSR